jgi:signal transduction histidine kinase
MVQYLAAAAALSALTACRTATPRPSAGEVDLQRYEHEETQALVTLVNDAAALIEAEGEAAFARLRVPDSRWRRGETYVFVVDAQGKMLVHPDPALEGRDELELKDVNGRPIIRGLIQAATAVPGKAEGWYHYEWPVPGGLLPRWKSSYVLLVRSPLGTRYLVSSGVYNDRMERAFVVDMVENAVEQIESSGEAAFPLFHDRTGSFIAKDAYIFVIDPRSGDELVNPAHPNLEGRNVLDVKDTQGKPFVREMLELARASGTGWVRYLWPKPGESISTEKSTYVSRAKVGDRWLLVGAGVYLSDAPKASVIASVMKAPDLMALVRDGAAVLEQRGPAAYPEFRTRGSRWFTDDTYFFVWTMDGARVFFAPDPSMEGQDASDEKDILGRPYGRMFLESAASPSGEGWSHYMYPAPDGLFPVWKSAFVKRVTFPDGSQHLLGAGVYNMQMDKAFVADMVDRAAALIESRGKGAFDVLRDKTGPFVFMDNYVFVETTAGVCVVEPGQPSLEGTNIIDVRDVRGKYLVRDYIDGALKHGAVWVEYYWYRPGYNTPFRKEAYVRKVQIGNETYVVGSGLYIDR